MDIFDKLNQSEYEFYFLVVDNSLDIFLPHLKNFHQIYAFKTPHLKTLRSQKLLYYCLEEKNIKLKEKNSGRLLSHPSTIKYIQSTSKNKKVVIIPFKPSAKVEVVCKKFNWIYSANNHQINRFLEDKIKFTYLCQKYNLPQIPTSTDIFNQTNFIKYQQKYHSNLVVQSHFGWAGKSTFFANNWNDIKDKIPLNTNVKYSPFLEGYSLLNNCCLTSEGLIQSPPALQYTGLKPFTQHPFTTVGRQWPCFAPKHIIKKIKFISQNFSSILKELNYKGYFGLDFFVYQNKVFLLECNPRLTASFAFYNEIEIKQNILPLFLIHLIQFLDLNLKIRLSHEQKRFNNFHIIGSEITVKNNKGQTTKKYHDFIAFSHNPKIITIPPKIITRLHEET